MGTQIFKIDGEMTEIIEPKIDIFKFKFFWYFQDFLTEKCRTVMRAVHGVGEVVVTDKNYHNTQEP